MQAVAFKEVGNIGFDEQRFMGEGYQLTLRLSDNHEWPSDVWHLVSEYAQRDLFILISSGQSCCETWGYCLEQGGSYTEEPVSDHIPDNQEVLRESIVGKVVTSVKWGADRSDSVACVNITTNHVHLAVLMVTIRMMYC